MNGGLEALYTSLPSQFLTFFYPSASPRTHIAIQTILLAVIPKPISSPGVLSRPSGSIPMSLTLA